MRKSLLTIILILLPLLSFAHPLGEKVFGHRISLSLTPARIECEYVVEIPTTVLAMKIADYMEKNNIAEFSDTESKKFNEMMFLTLKNGLELYINGVRYPMEPDPKIANESGKGDLNFFEYRLKLFTPLQNANDGESFSIALTNKNIQEREAVYLDGIISKSGIKIEDSNIPKTLEWSKDNTFRNINVSFKLDKRETEETRLGGFVERQIHSNDKLTSYLYQTKLDLPILLLAIGTAFLLGTAHALSPGHGKALVGAYLVGSQGKHIHALMLGLIVTVTHTAAVFVFGMIYLFFSKELLTEKFVPYVGIMSGASIFLIGAYLLHKRWHEYKHSKDGHTHEHPPLTHKSLLAIGISGGIVPCPTALALMLVAISINRVGFGMILVIAFSIGLTTVLTILGTLAIHATSIFKRYDEKGMFFRVIPLISAVVVIIIGIGIAFASWKVIS